MDCPNCGKAFHDEWDETTILSYTNKYPYRWESNITLCPACSEVTIELVRYAPGANTFREVFRIRVFPQSVFRRPISNDVPELMKEDYGEACRVLPISEKASAALARRCLQLVLREQGYPQHDLARQIDALLQEPDPAKAIPASLRRTIDAIRQFGNFSAHPITDKTTLQVIKVEPHEADWCLTILEEVFEHYYVKPAEAAARMAALNARLEAAGKPPSKGG